MFCEKCGNELKEGATFCSRCGARQGETPVSASAPTVTSAQILTTSDKKASHKGLIIAIAVACFIIVAAVVLLVTFVFGGQGGSADDGTGEGKGTEIGEENDTEAGKEDSPKNDEGESANSGEMKDAQETQALPDTPLYGTLELSIIDLSVQKVVPGTKAEGMDWDRSLFYWLEDADTTVDTDGNIARCRLSKTMLRNAESGKPVQYEIYSDPDNGNIYKIVSIEEVDVGYRLTDYYYQNGKPNFLFERYDSVYTPIYATTDKTGERFYIDSDVLVRWRKIQVPGQIEEYTLNPNNPWYTQKSYFAESEEFRGIFDREEIKRLNAAYNTYEAVINGSRIGLVEGMLSDTLGNPQAGVEVNIRRSSDNVLLYQTTTDDRGAFSLYVYLEDVECYLSVAASGNFRELTAYGINLKDSALTYSYNLVLHKVSGDEYPVTLCAYPAMDIRTDGSGAAAPVAAITAAVREGSRAYLGETAAVVQADENGMATVNLMSGTYTVQLSAEGYMDTYLEIEVGDSAVSQAAYVIPYIAETQTAVVMTWDSSDIDLDLTLFTPHQSTGGDMAHVGGKTLGDGFGNMLIADNGNTCEVMFVNSGEAGSHKLYVNNYTHSVAGNYTSDQLQHVNVHVYIYNSNGFVADYTVPLGQIGVVWEVAEINGTTITPGQRVYTEITGKTWWMENKSGTELLQAYLDSELVPRYGYADLSARERTFYPLDGYSYDISSTWTEVSGIADAEILDLDNDGNNELLVIMVDGQYIRMDVYEIENNVPVRKAGVTDMRKGGYAGDEACFEEVVSLISAGDKRYLLLTSRFTGFATGDGYYSYAKLYQYNGEKLYTPLTIMQTSVASSEFEYKARQYDENSNLLSEDLIFRSWEEEHAEEYCHRRMADLFGGYGIAIGENAAMRDYNHINDGIFDQFLAPDTEHEELLELRMKGEHFREYVIYYFNH